MRRRLATLAALPVALLLALTGCAQIPSEGPVLVEPQRTREADQPIDILPHPPAPDSSPGKVVQGFLLAMAEGRGDYSVARAYLTKAAGERWAPTEQAVIYTASSQRLTVTDSAAVLEAEVQGRLDRRGTFTRVQDPYRIDFGLVQENGQWRIANPPAGLLLLEDLFEHAFAPATLYYFDPAYQVLVPDVVYVPKLKRTGTFLVSQLRLGPTDWLRPAVKSALPGGTQLAGEVTVTSDGVATIPLTGLGLLDAASQAALAAQLAATLGANPGPVAITHFRVQVDGAVLALPQSDSNGVVPVEGFARYVATNRQTSQKVFGVSRDRLVGVTDTTTGATVEEVPGPVGAAGLKIDKLGVAFDSSSVALVTDGSSRLQLANLLDGRPREVLARPGLLAPQYSRFDEVWAVAATPQGSTVFRVVGGAATKVEAPELDGVEVKAFRLSPDGVRMAVVLARGEATQVAVLQVRRGERVTLEGLRVLHLTGVAAPHVVTSIGWRSDRVLSLLGSEQGKTEVNPYEIDQDAASIRRTSTQTWDATRLQTSPYNGRFVALAVGQGGQVWRRGEDALWRRWVGDMSAVAVAG